MGYSRISDANEITARYMDGIMIQERLIDSVVADTGIDFLGTKFAMPVMTPAFTRSTMELVSISEWMPRVKAALEDGKRILLGITKASLAT